MISSQKTPIIDALKKYSNDRTIRFHMPGHKGNPATNNQAVSFLGHQAFVADVTNVPGMDDLHQPHGAIRESQNLAAAAFGADQTYYLINGSSCGLQALVMAACNPGEKILVPRNIHRSILSGIILSGALPIFFLPEYDEEYGIPLGTSPESIENCLRLHPDARAVLLVYPTYQGIVSDIEAIAQIVHRYDIPLLVDEAHGPHFGFHENLPKTALEAGADASVHGTHKMLTSFTQASMLHIKGNRINRQRLEATLKILQSTSTSYLLLASLDGARAQMECHGRELVQQALETSMFLREEIAKLPGYQVLGEEMLGRPGVFDIDLTKINIGVNKLMISGLWAEQWLRQSYHIQVEMADIFNVLLLVTAGNGQADANDLLQGLGELTKYLEQNKDISDNFTAIKGINPFPFIPELAMSPREAFLGSPTPLPLDKAQGAISAEVITCYPPGVPVICPGERFTTEIINYLRATKEIGIHFQGCYDTDLKTVLIIKE